MTAGVTFFRPSEVVLLLEPLKRNHANANLDGLEPLLAKHGVRVSGLGERHIVMRGGRSRVLQSIYVDGRKTEEAPWPLGPKAQNDEALLQSMQAVVDAVNILNGPPGKGASGPVIESGTFRVIAAAPNWFAIPFQ